MASTAREENAYTLGVQAGLWGYPLVHRVKAFPQTLLLGRIRDLEAEWTQDAVQRDRRRQRHPQTARNSLGGRHHALCSGLP